MGTISSGLELRVGRLDGKARDDVLQLLGKTAPRHQIPHISGKGADDLVMEVRSRLSK